MAEAARRGRAEMGEEGNEVGGGEEGVGGGSGQGGRIGRREVVRLEGGLKGWIRIPVREMGGGKGRWRSKSVQSTVSRVDSDAHTNKVLRGPKAGTVHSG